ncbi:uncharacterized protein LOC127082444 [Lathyrus oleraceus]|uniref:uncharacterized protein LOC127082444 n=1 Tax=Pisum sativum TaxID=3888 RepID=UPI0021CF65BD|nr:uncharacterized protein LOC127082444 [Pisum sativum]
MSQHQTPSGSKTTKPTHKDNTPSVDFLDDEILDVVPLSVISGEALDLNHPMDASASACPNQGHSVKGVSTPLSIMYLSPEVEPHSEKDDDSSRFGKDMVAEGLCSLGQTVSSKRKPMASITANAYHSEKHDSANNVIDLEDDSMAKSMKTRKGRSVAEMMSAKTAKKTADVDPSKSWSKVDVKKRKRTTVRKSPMKVVIVHWDNISFHLEDGAAKWKFVIQRRVAVERELGNDDVEVKEVMDLIKNVGLMKIVVGLSQCYEGLFLGRSIEGAGELEAINNEVCREITARQMKEWPIKKHIPVGKLTAKYAILHKIGSVNWVSTNHISTISNTLGRFIFAVGTKLKFGYGSHVEDIVMTSAMKESLEALIASLERAEGENIEQVKEAEAQTSSERSVTNDQTSGNFVSDADEAASSSSSD